MKIDIEITETDHETDLIVSIEYFNLFNLFSITSGKINLGLLANS